MLIKRLKPRIWNLKTDYDILCKLVISNYKLNCLRCVLCGSTWNIQLHHKLMRSAVSNDVFIEENGILYSRDSWRNLISLCEKCHLGLVHGSSKIAKKMSLIKSKYGVKTIKTKNL